MQNTNATHFAVRPLPAKIAKAGLCNETKTDTVDLMQFLSELQVVSEMSKAERSALMKFATSVSRAPLGGFKHLNPSLTVHKAGPVLPAQIQPDSPDGLGRSSGIAYIDRSTCRASPGCLSSTVFMCRLRALYRLCRCLMIVS